ncbi:MAG: DUF3795 domain-containing protein [Proteobacteria bacterium]|nr:DUF3795 domain-containing protein [Pseudomonadota bacterium]
MTETMIAYCGIPCSECPARLATIRDDDEAREKTAQMWGKQFGMKLTVADINCDGCLTDGGRLFGHCATCHMRHCARDRDLENCAYCADYPCETLAGFFKMVPYAQPALEKIRATL